MTTKIRDAVATWRATYDELHTEADSGIEILQAVILAAGLGAAAVVIVGAVTGAIDGWLSRIPL